MVDKFKGNNITLEKVFNAETNNFIDYLFISNTNERIELGLKNAFMFLILEQLETKCGMQESRIYFSLPAQRQTIEISVEETAHLITVNTEFVEIFMTNRHLLTSSRSNYIVFQNLKDLYWLLMVDLSMLSSELNGEKKDQKYIHLRTRLIIKGIDDMIGKGVPVENSLLPKPIIEFNQLVNQYFTKHKEPLFYARELNISRGYLNVLNKKYLGMSTKEIIDQRIVQEAKSLLIHSNLTSKEITFRLGFKCMSTFSHFLKLKTGMTSMQIRNKV